MRRAGWILGLLLPAIAQSSWAQPDPPVRPSTAELIERERIRSTIETAFVLINARPTERAGSLEDFVDATERVLALGPPAVEFLLPDLEAPRPERFFFAVYVLGRLGAPEAEQPIRRALAAADQEPVEIEFSRHRKAWCAYALAMLGHADAVDLLDAGNRKAARTELTRDLTALEAAALLTAPASTERLVKQLDRYLQDEELKQRRQFTLRALMRIADPSVRQPAILKLVDDDDPRVRAECIKLLGTLDVPEDRVKLVAALEDPVYAVRAAAVNALAEALPSELTGQILAALETQNELYVRGRLYETVAGLLGARALNVFRTYWDRGPDDRAWIVRAMARVQDPRGLALLREALRDPNDSVRSVAVLALGKLQSSGATEALLTALRDPDWPVRLEAIRLLVERGERRAGPRVATLLVDETLPAFWTSGPLRTRVRQMGDALVALRYTAPLDRLRQAVPKLDDPETATFLTRVIKLLAALDARQDKRAEWIETLTDPDPDLRRLATERLGELGDDASIDALVQAFDRTDDAERLWILEALGKAASPRAAPLLERVLNANEFDLATRSAVREMAAWAARSIGGEKMTGALRRSVERREGQDYPVLIYLAQLAEAEALPTLQLVRAARVKHPKWDRGLQQQKLEWVIRQLAAGRSIRDLDRPPAALAFAG